MAVACSNTRVSETTDTAATKQWYALEVWRRSEKKVDLLLRTKGYECIPALYKSKRRGYDRVREREIPLFPGYIFCRFDAARRLPILVTPGVLRIVGVGKQPVAIHDSEIAAIELVVASGLPAEPWPFEENNQVVRIVAGPLSGVEGTIVDRKSRGRLVVSVTLLRRSVAVVLDGDFLVEPIRKSVTQEPGSIRSGRIVYA
jgi:transcription antitermination factor NusG